MELEPAWYEYATFDESGHVNGIRGDAPQEAKDAYKEEQDRLKEYTEKGEFIPR